MDAERSCSYMLRTASRRERESRRKSLSLRPGPTQRACPRTGRTRARLRARVRMRSSAAWPPVSDSWLVGMSRACCRHRIPRITRSPAPITERANATCTRRAPGRRCARRHHCAERTDVIEVGTHPPAQRRHPAASALGQSAGFLWARVARFRLVACSTNTARASRFRRRAEHSRTALDRNIRDQRAQILRVGT